MYAQLHCIMYAKLHCIVRTYVGTARTHRYNQDGEEISRNHAMKECQAHFVLDRDVKKQHTFGGGGGGDMPNGLTCFALVFFSAI